MNKWLEKLKHAKGLIVALAGGGAVLSGLVGYYTTYQTVTSSASPSVASAPALVNTGALSIVVLPFANQTGDVQRGYIADALTTSITADLSRIRDAFVVSTRTAFAYKDKPVTAQQVGKEVGARFALQGSVLASGDKVRITAQLADTQTGAQLWSETFDGDLTNLFVLQDQITARVSNGIGREMVVIAARESEKQKSNPKAADLLLQARASALKPLSPVNLKQTDDLFRQVLTIEPNNTTALAGQVYALSLIAVNASSGMTPEEKEKIWEEARHLALKLKDIDPRIPDSYGLLSSYALNHNDFAGAKRAAEAFVELDPKNPVAYNRLALVYLSENNPQKMLDILTQGINLDPKNASEILITNSGAAHYYLNNDKAVIELLSKVVDKYPNTTIARTILAASYARQGELEKAKAMSAELLRINPKFKLSEMLQRRIAYKIWESKFLPYAKQAGLPE